MALKISKLISLRASTIVKVNADTGETAQVAYFDAQISQDGSQSYNNMNITNQDLYLANKDQVRKDKSDFDAAVWDAEDSITSEG